ncbi:MAG TPA: hypothetical protein VK106_00335 [Balneolaceae bacterium]|nr:hypothetical protein [Balneolaceae bacterium]
MSRYNVEKCICHNKRFEVIKEYAEEHDIKSIEELQERHYCSCGCRMCAPYVELMLKTGKTSFKPGEYYRG